jgi:hypothetical protein
MFRDLVESIRLEARTKDQQLTGLRRMHYAAGHSPPPASGWQGGYRDKDLSPAERNKVKMRSDLHLSRKPDKLADKAHVKDLEKEVPRAFEKLRKGIHSEAMTKSQQYAGLAHQTADYGEKPSPPESPADVSGMRAYRKSDSDPIARRKPGEAMKRARRDKSINDRRDRLAAKAAKERTMTRAEMIAANAAMKKRKSSVDEGRSKALQIKGQEAMMKRDFPKRFDRWDNDRKAIVASGKKIDDGERAVPRFLNQRAGRVKDDPENDKK